MADHPLHVERTPPDERDADYLREQAADRLAEKAPYEDVDRDDWAENSGHGAMWGYRER